MSPSLRRAINNFLSLHSMTSSRFGRLTLGDPNLIRDLRRGRNPRPQTVAAIMSFINNYTE